MSQELHSDQQADYKTDTGFGISDLASQARERYQAVLATEGKPWEEVDQDEQAQWITACEALTEFYLEEIDKQHWRDIARRFTYAFYGQDTWQSLKRPIKLAYEVVVRHIWNMHSSIDQEDVQAALEFDWPKWFLPKCKEMSDG